MISPDANPYESPRARQQAASVDGVDPFSGYRSTRGLASSVVALLVLNVVINLVSIIANLYGLQRWINWSPDIESEPSFVNVLFGFVEQGRVMVDVGLMFLCCGVFLWWIYRAHANLMALNARGQSFTPLQAVGWWFVPLATWWKPAEVMSEIWRASDPEQLDWFAWRDIPATPLLKPWWGAWLLSGWIGMTVFSFAARVMFDRDTAQVLGWCGTNAASIVAAALAVVLVRGIVARQDEKCRRLNEPVAG